MAIALADLPTKVLEELKVIGGEETPSEADQEKVLEVYGYWWNEASRDDQIDWDNDDDIPDGAEQAVIWLIANRVAQTFNKPYSPDRQKLGEDLLRKAVRILPGYDEVESDYF